MQPVAHVHLLAIFRGGFQPKPNVQPLKLSGLERQFRSDPIRNNLGAALRSLRERESGTAKLDEAVVAYREALGRDRAGTAGGAGSRPAILASTLNVIEAITVMPRL
jgi:hypothetical protein